MQGNVYSLNGEVLRKITLPKQFEEKVDAILIRRAVLAAQSSAIQPKGPNPRAGRGYTAQYVGCRKKPQKHRTINVGHARLPRRKDRGSILSGAVALVPQAVGGPKAHKLKKEANTREKINKKERRKALRSAIAASADAGLVEARGHRLGKDLKLPLVADAALEKLERTREVKQVLEKLGLWGDVERAKGKRKLRAGKGRRRGRRYKKAKSLLIVVGEPGKIYRAARNLEGVDICGIKNLNVELLAPGGKPGRLTLWSEPAIKQIGE